MNKKSNILDLNKSICSYIKQRFFSPFTINGESSSLNKYADACQLSSSTISKINEGKGYNIPVSTIYSICSFEKIPLKDFFIEFEKSQLE